MKIASKNEFHSLVNSLQSLLDEKRVSIKTSRAQELLARSLGHKSANGLYAVLPLDISLTEAISDTFGKMLKEKHSIDSIDSWSLLCSLENKHKSSSTTWNSDDKCYPKQIPPNENLWYLTKDGWISWSQVDFTKMRVELNIYKVVQSSFLPFLDECTFTGSARPIWTAESGSLEFELEADKLEKVYGRMPKNERMFTV
jgi:hypothetical protein